MLRWDDVNARARGLATHLLRPAQVPALAAAADLPDLLRRLERAGCRLVLAHGWSRSLPQYVTCLASSPPALRGRSRASSR